MSDDRRQHERFELLVQVAARHHEQRDTLTVINISAGGVLLRNDRNIAYAVGEEIQIQFDAPELAAAFTLEAQVVRIVTPAGRPGLVAGMWRSSDAVANAALSDLLFGLSQRR